VTLETQPQDDAIPSEEERLLERVAASLQQRTRPQRARSSAYDQELVALRDEIAEARMEDVAALIAQMERLQGVSLQKAEARSVLVDPHSPYFGHLRLREQAPDGRTVDRDVLVGRATFIDPSNRVNIVDWRNAPISQLYYRYEEGSDYEERFGDREVEGEILARRTVTIEDGVLARVDCPQGLWLREPGGWVRTDLTAHELAGGEGTAARPPAPTPGSPSRSAGSGWNGGPPAAVLGTQARGRQRLDRHLPEIAALVDPRQFELITTPRSGVVVIQGGAGSGKTTIGLHRIAYLAYAAPDRFRPRRMLVVTYGSALAAYISQVLPALDVHGVGVITFQTWVARELRRALPNLDARVVDEAPPVVARLKNHPALLEELQRRARAQRGPRTSRAVLELWAELLTDRDRLLALLTGDRTAPMREAEVTEALRLMRDRIAAFVDREPGTRRRRDRAGQQPDDDDVRGHTGIDGLETVDSATVLDLEDASILLRAHQLLRGIKRPLAHLFVDEAQDLSPVQLSTLIGATTSERSVTLAGDTAQRLLLDSGFLDWRTVLRQLGLAHVAVEPLKISYRSTREILALARHVMGPLADPDPPRAPRSGAPVEAHRFPGTGAAVAFLAEALRPLFAREPRATVAILTRHPEEADRYFQGLRRAEVPLLRRVRDQEFAFRPGVEVTEIRQVKGLEFDYVVVCETNANVFGLDDESRHLLHIAATRAAHQLWLLVTSTPSPLLPAQLLG
jgi:DNA helicase-2/ATP-dependent DNA helicase PcrA